MKTDEASSTAYTVAQGIVYSGRYSPDREHVPVQLLESSEIILESSSDGRKLLRQLRNPAVRLLLKLFERLTLPGMSFHYVLRKTYIEYSVRQAIASGVKQVIILGAGFDMLAYMLSKEFKEVEFLEIDHPATSKDKQNALDPQVIERPNLHFSAVDFSQQSLSEALSSNSNFDSGLSSVFVCEGVLMYLSENDVSNLLVSIRESAVGDCRFVFTSLEPLQSPQNDCGLILRLYLRAKSESLAWFCPQSSISLVLEKHGLRMDESANDGQIASQLMPNLRRKRFHKGEYVVNASKQESQNNLS
ncbi:class I SAM-dependent methyltransferase [Synechococcus sp. CC9616]|jgi:methyltransferase (TIGR00027 family)|uniref:class I SAM-dependent methyltransferase n=1 Tax=Synechococcus sp. CC9616 TaxID=110663 RepID=UPI0004B636E6|nr:class I SAM-dependent methyltransferase [Synechococcus sp. CC9616]|tara:strand:+ start:2385 stop:3293 length:909 start_codon:yes stop_codon:yes gene_type:complete